MDDISSQTLLRTVAQDWAKMKAEKEPFKKFYDNYNLLIDEDEISLEEKNQNSYHMRPTTVSKNEENNEAMTGIENNNNDGYSPRVSKGVCMEYFFIQM